MAIPTPTAYWKLDESSGNAVDSVGSNTLTARGTVTYAAAKINNGAVFGTSYATTNSLGRTDGLGINLASSASVGFWIKLNSEISSGSTRFFSWRSTTGTAKYTDVFYEYNGGTRRLNFFGGAFTSQFTANTTLGTGWNYIAFTFNGSTTTAYVNGLIVGSGTISNASGGNWFWLNGASDSTDQGAPATFDETGVWNVTLTQDEILKIYNAGRGNAYPFTENLTIGLASYWNLNESSGNAADSIGSNTGANNSVTYGAGKISNAATFTETSYLNCGTDSSLQLKVFTFAGWVKTSDTTNNKTIIVGNGGGGSGFQWRIETNLKQQLNKQGAAGIGTSTNAVTSGTYCHVGVVYNSVTGAYKFYLNGSPDGSGTSAQTLTQGAFYIGYNNGSEGYIGDIDELGVWARELSDADFTELYNSGSGKTYPFTTNVDVTVSSTVVTATFSAQARTVTGSATVSSTVQSAVFSSPASTVIGTAVAFPSAVAAVFSLPAVNVLTPDVQVLVDAVSATFSVQEPTVVILTPDITVTPNAVTATFTVASPTIYAEKNAHACPNAVIATFTVESPTVTTERNVIVEPLVLSAVFTVLTPRKVGGLWTMTPRVEGVWTPQARVI